MKFLWFSCLILVGSELSSISCHPASVGISGGDDTSIEYHPWLVAIWQESPESAFLGSGFLISPSRVITAASVLRDYNASFVRSGSTYYASGGVTSQIANQTLHPDFDSVVGTSDIAVIQLATPVTGDNIAPIDLPDASSVNVRTGDVFTVAGWGQTQLGNQTLSDVLQEVNLIAISTNLCEIIYGDVLDSEFCAEGSSGVEGVCTGDTGGPVLWNKLPIALVSIYRLCGTFVPPIFTNLIIYLDWINSVAGN